MFEFRTLDIGRLPAVRDARERRPVAGMQGPGDRIELLPQPALPRDRMARQVSMRKILLMPELVSGIKLSRRDFDERQIKADLYSGPLISDGRVA
jgi:hypothetical protein